MLRHRPHLLFGVVFAAFLVLCLVLLAGIGTAVVRKDLSARLDAEEAGFRTRTAEISNVLGALKAQPRVDPCSEPFMQWLRRVAFLPDGIHEISYIENNQLLCSVSLGKLDTPIALDRFDFPATAGGTSEVSLNRDLSMFGLPGLVGNFLKVGNFLLVLPEFELYAPMPAPTLFEVVNVAGDGQAWHRAGEYGLFSHVTGIPSVTPWTKAFPLGFTDQRCNMNDTLCIAVLEPLVPLINRSAGSVLGGFVLALLMAGTLTRIVRWILIREWALPARFRRNLSPETVVCHYQPLLDIRNDRICGVEVLARWRDDDGALVYPDKFLPVVEQYKLHREFTRMVVQRAYEDLRHIGPVAEPLFIHFNIFPSDFDPDWMLELFMEFMADAARFTVVIELVESDALPIDSTRSAIARLRRAGIFTFIDDFGEGYSSIGYLAGLGTHGVKLDRSFALAPEGSLMDAMLASAIDMVGKTGQILVVEGVETASRLASLHNTPVVTIAQGYFISRPLPFDEVKTLLHHRGRFSEARAAAA